MCKKNRLAQLKYLDLEIAYLMKKKGFEVPLQKSKKEKEDLVKYIKKVKGDPVLLQMLEQVYINKENVGAVIAENCNTRDSYHKKLYTHIDNNPFPPKHKAHEAKKVAFAEKQVKTAFLQVKKRDSNESKALSSQELAEFISFLDDTSCRLIAFYYIIERMKDTDIASALKIERESVLRKLNTYLDC